MEIRWCLKQIVHRKVEGFGSVTFLQVDPDPTTNTIEFKIPIEAGHVSAMLLIL